MLSASFYLSIYLSIIEIHGHWHVDARCYCVLCKFSRNFDKFYLMLSPSWLATELTHNGSCADGKEKRPICVAAA